MALDYNSAESLAPVIEALLFASDEPLSAQSLRMLVLGEEIERTSIEDEEPKEEEPKEREAQAAEVAEENTSDQENTNGHLVSTNGHSHEAATDTEQQGEAHQVAAGPTPEQVIAEPTEENAESVEEVETVAAPAKKEKAKRKKKYPIEVTIIHEAVEMLNTQYLDTNRSFRIIEIAGGFQFATRPEYSEYVARLFKEKSRRRLSGASLETLAIIAYKQPVSKQDIENIRGVNCDEVIKSLLEKNLITITGRAEAVGRPLLYGSTTEFLRHFGLHTLTDLPKPREIEELLKEEAIKATTLDEAASELLSQPNEEHVTLDEAVAFLKSHEQEEENSSNAQEDNASTSEADISRTQADDDAEKEALGIELDVDAMDSTNDVAPLAEVDPAEIEEPEDEENIGLTEEELTDEGF